jgi:hypothetical protein
MYLEKPNAKWDIGKNWYYAQTFALTTASTIWRECFRLCAEMPFDLWYFSIRLTDINGKPLSVDLYQDTRTSKNTPTCHMKQESWQCMDWPFHLLPAGTYAIVIGRPGSPDSMRGHIAGSTGVTTTPTRKAWQSNDYGVTWTEMPNTVLSHACWGHVPPVTPPTPPEIGNWYIKTIVYNERPDGYQIVVTTDRLITLYLRWTLAPPGQHIKETLERGAPVQKLIDQCFVATNDVNQVEEGDTLTHTFNIDGWPVCQTRWFYFWGTRAMKRVPSVSPIYEKHKVPNVLPTPRCSAKELTWYISGAYNCYHYGSSFRPTSSFYITSFDVQFKRVLSSTQCVKGLARIDLAGTTGKPTSTFLGPYYFTIPPLAVGQSVIINVPVPKTQLIAGTAYAIVSGTWDNTIGWPWGGIPNIAFVRASTPTCPHTSYLTYFRIYDRVRNSPCRGLVTDWTLVAPNTHTLYFQTYGTDNP